MVVSAVVVILLYMSQLHACFGIREHLGFYHSYPNLIREDYFISGPLDSVCVLTNSYSYIILSSLLTSHLELRLGLVI